MVKEVADVLVLLSQQIILDTRFAEVWSFEDSNIFFWIGDINAACGCIEGRFEACLSKLTSVFGYAGRIEPLHDYCCGLLPPGERLPPKEPKFARNLPFPIAQNPEASPSRPERHVPNSTVTLRKNLTIAVASPFTRCTCCQNRFKTMNFMTQQT
jgi:hypothetical protein